MTSPQWSADTLHHTWPFNTRIKTRRENSTAKKHVHFSIHLDCLPHHLEEIQISQEIAQTGELGLPSLDLAAKQTVSYGHSSPGKYCLGRVRKQISVHVRNPHTAPLHTGTHWKFVPGSTVRLHWSAEGKMAFYKCLQKPEFYPCKHF